MPRSPLLRLMLALFLVDVGFSALFGYIFFVMLAIEGDSVSTALPVLLGVWFVKVLTWAAIIWVRMRPLLDWTDDPKAKQDRKVIQEVGSVLYRAPLMVGFVWSAAFAASYLVGALVLFFGFADSVPLGPRSIDAATLCSVGIIAGAQDLIFPLTERMLAPLVEQLSLAAYEHGITIPGSGFSIRMRLVAFALTLVAAPSFFLSGITYINDARSEQRDVTRRAEIAAAEVALGHEGSPKVLDGWTFTFDSSAKITGREAERVFAERPRLARQFEDSVAATPTGTTAHPRDGVVAFRTEGDRRVGVVIPIPERASFGIILLIILFLMIIVTWGPLCALLMASATAVPVTRISQALAKVGAGEVSEARRVPVFHQDEVGSLSQNYNVMLDQLRMLASRALEVSKGKLDVEFELRGDLGEAFRSQITSLRDIVGHIAQSAAQLASAASEMYAAAQEQEATAQQQSVGVEEVSRTMESLLVAATHVTESTTGVLSRAERTRETTSRTGERITELSVHASRIGEILEVIREIADRSDLLALNASLEGTRAGEAGRGFALVAGEMRKLAERVTASVADIKKLVADVRASVSATVISTEESTTLATGTSEAARQINLVTQQQRSGTEQAGQSMRDVASQITQSLAATQQIRSLAEDLKVQADNLTGMVSRFKLPTKRSEVSS